MTSFVINSDIALQSRIGDIRDLYQKHRYLKVSVRAGVDRSIDQNAISHDWYEQIARELREDDAVGWKSYCKLHHGVPILRTENEDFRAFYDAGLKSLTYEAKLKAMKFVPVTSLMTVKQMTAYLESLQGDFRRRGVILESSFDGAKQ